MSFHVGSGRWRRGNGPKGQEEVASEEKTEEEGAVNDAEKDATDVEKDAQKDVEKRKKVSFAEKGAAGDFAANQGPAPVRSLVHSSFSFAKLQASLLISTFVQQLV